MFLTPKARIEEYTARGWWGDLVVDNLLQRNREAAPHRLALVDPANRETLDGKAPQRFTWSQLGDAVDRMAAAFLELGLVKDDIVTYQTPNVAETVIVALAAARIGLIISPVVMPYRKHELDYILGIVEPKAIVTVASFAGCEHAKMALGLDWRGRAPKVMVIGGGAPEGAVDLDAAMERADPERTLRYRASNPVSPGEVFTIFWTSGTEARPKGVPRDHNHWIVNARMVSELADLREGETLLNPFPLVNIASFGMVMPWLWRCGTLVLHHPFDLAVFLKQIAVERVNYTIVPPAILNAILKSDELLKTIDLSSVRAIGSGSAPLSPWMIEGFAKQFGIEVCNIYGSNEGASLFSNQRHAPSHEDRARYFPRLGVPGIEWEGETAAMIKSRLVDPETEEEIVEPGRVGELRFKGAHVFGGYYKLPEITRNAFDAEGYYKSGDLFEIAGDGPTPRFYRFVGRCKDIIVRGGMNISPAEIDDLLAGHPDFREAAVVGVPDETLGERMCAAVAPKGGAPPPDVKAVAAWLKERGVAVFKLPERLVVVDALPRNPMNKVMRKELRDKVLDILGE